MERSMGRRAFVRDGALYLSALACGGWLSRSARVAGAADGAERPALRVGLVTDIHYGDKEAAGSRHYRESLGRLGRGIARLNALEADFVVELGDFIDAAPGVAREIRWLERIEKAFAAFEGDRHYVLGNHCVTTLTKKEFFAHTGAEEGHYSFDRGGLHFVVLDACFRSDETPYGRRNFDWKDTEIPRAQRRWLADDLRRTEKKTIVFVHQRIDLDPPSPYVVKSAAAVRQILRDPGKVVAVFQGHNHVNDLRTLDGIHYCTLPAVVEGSGPERNAFALLEVYRDGSLRLEGFGEAKSYPRKRLARG